MKVIEQKIRSLYHSTVFLLLVSEFLHIFSFFRVCLCRHFVCFSPVSRSRTQIFSLFILDAILNKFPLSVDKSVTWFLLCARVFSPAAVILEREKTLVTKLVQKKSFCKPPSLLEDLTATEILFQSYAATTTTDWLAYHITSEDMFTREDITTMMHPFPLPELSFRSARFARGFFFSHFSPQVACINIWNPAKFVKTSLIKQVKKISKALIV